MKSISIPDLLASGYSENPAARRSFRRKTAPLTRICMLGIVIGFILALVLRRPGFGLLGIVSLGLFCYSVWVYPFLSIPREPTSDKPMVRYKNAHPGDGTFLEIIFVCPVSKTFFKWPVFSKPAFFS